MPVDTIRWVGDIDGHAELVDQTRLPADFTYVKCTSVQDMWEAIRALKVRGAPAIGIAGAMGLVLALQQSDAGDTAALLDDLKEAKEYLEKSRPTAVNLFWALHRMQKVAARNRNLDVPELRSRLLDEARQIAEEDRQTCRAIGKNGAELLNDGDSVLTHCNAGGLATADYGTALGVLFAAHEAGKDISVYADETRPLLQGARLTTWELQEAGIPVTLICDSMAGLVIREGRVNCVLVGADRIAANGDTANKIGTYTLSVLAGNHDIPFYVAAPVSTFDMSLEDGSDIPIEEREPEEVVRWGDHQTAPDGIQVYNPAFDVTPADSITAIITEKGIIKRPSRDKIAEMLT